MLAPISYSALRTALETPQGWTELAVVAMCFGLGWLLDRRLRLRSASATRSMRMSLGSVNRMLFPLATLVLLLIAGAAFRRFGQPFFISIALPLTIALAVIRLIVYGMRELFGAPAWLPASERAIGFAIWGMLLLYFTGVLWEIREELKAMELPLGSKSISAYEVIRGTVAVLLTIAVTLWLSGLIEQRLLRTPHMDTSVRTVLAKLVRAGLLVFGILFALQAVGIDLTVLTVFWGALGVGIGLGLQKLASNYIAGFTILLDRSVRLGDMITVDNRTGVVSKVTFRYVVLRSLDGIDAIVPNETLATTTVLNHSYTTREVRFGMPVHITYDSDLNRALALLVEAARAEPRVLPAPNGPEAYVVRFADAGIDLELGVWINDPENGQLNLRSAINRRIWESFKENGIKIPVPAREYRLVVDGDKAPAAGLSATRGSG